LTVAQRTQTPPSPLRSPLTRSTSIFDRQHASNDAMSDDQDDSDRERYERERRDQ
jgi:hypothetical protein